MARRRDTGTVSFDVSYDAGDAPADDDAPVAPAPPSWPRRAGDRWRATPPRQRRLTGLAAGALVVVVAGGWATTSAVSASAEAQRLREAPGGVLSLAGPLAVTAEAESDDLAAVLPDGTLALVDGDDVVGWDVVSGTETWRTSVGADPWCGPRPQVAGAVDWATPMDVVTCVHDDGARVTVLTADGDVTGSRDLPAATYGLDHQIVAPARDGGLVVVRHDPGVPESVDLELEGSDADPWAEIDALERPTATGTVRVEDALTGDLRFDVPLADTGEFGTTSGCYDFFVSDDPDAPEATLRAPTVVATPHLVSYLFCGAAARAGADGTELPAPDGEYLGAEVWYHGGDGVQVAGDGTFFVAAGTGTRVVRADGTPDRRTEQLLAPVAADGSGGLPTIAVEGRGVTVALDAQGEQLWRVDEDGDSTSMVTQTAGTVVAVSWGEAVAYDASDGAERWRLPLTAAGLGAPDRAASEWNPLAAVTDGVRVTMLVEGYRAFGGASQYALLTVDLATGEPTLDVLGPDVVPERDEQSGWGLPWLVAVDGEPVLLDLSFTGRGGYEVRAVRTLGTD